MGVGATPGGVAEGIVTILFTDVEGSTALHAAKGDTEARAVLGACDELARREVKEHDGRAIKSLGDGLMAAFASPLKALACGLAIQDAVSDHGQGHPGQQLRVRVGIHTGMAAAERGDLYGGAVNAAARICAKAQGGEVLVSDVLRQLCGASRGGLRGTWRCPGGVGLQALITQHPGRPDGPPGGEACPAGATG
jgi:class 3 adenylate cyclase